MAELTPDDPQEEEAARMEVEPRKLKESRAEEKPEVEKDLTSSSEVGYQEYGAPQSYDELKIYLTELEERMDRLEELDQQSERAVAGLDELRDYLGELLVYLEEETGETVPAPPEPVTVQ